MNGLTTKKPFEHVYSDKTYALLQDEFPQQDKNICYLEHAGATLYSSRQISDICDDLKSNIFANPHAKSTSSKLTEDLIDQVRIQILHHFNTSSKDYTVIFTSGSTAALKLLGESFCYKNGTFSYLQDNHTSVLGMREYSKNIFPITPSQAKEIFDNNNSCNGYSENNSLFVFPAQSNFSGTKYDLNWIRKAQNGALGNNNSKWYCCLDAASFVSTNSLDLSKYQPDFVCLSFYKIFGYPTGLGALIVKNDSAGVLERNYFGGGTVFMALATEKFVVPRTNLHEKFEDGTLPFLAILSLRHGFSTLKRLQLKMDDISKHTFNLAKYTHDKMAALNHNNGRPLCQLYSDNNFENIENQGGIVNFNLLHPDGNYVGFAQVLHIANLFGIQLRTGCFCNPGACQQHLDLTIDDLKRHYEAGHVCGDQNDLIDGQPTGSIRISFGYMSTKKDADTFLKTIIDCFCQKPIIIKNHTEGLKSNLQKDSGSILQNGDSINKNWSSGNENHLGTLENIFIYPVKSCAAFEVKNSWSLTSKGLKFDRNWMIVNESGICMTQKQMIGLCKLRPIIDVENDILTLHYEDAPSVSVPLTLRQDNKLERRSVCCQTKICKDVVSTLDCGDTVSRWISTVLNQSGLRLLRQNDVDSSRCTKSNAEMSLANQAQYLLINLSSLKWLRSQITDPDFGDDLHSMIQRFRPNFVVSFDSPFIESDFTSFSMEDGLNFASDGSCTRCQMVCVNQFTGEKTVEPLKTLSKILNGKISFGVYLRKCDTSNYKHVEIAPGCTIVAK